MQVDNLAGLALRGKVDAPDGGAQFATVRLRDYPRETITNKDGSFRFEDLPDGEFDVVGISIDGALRGSARAHAGDENIRLSLEPSTEASR
jgi:hypothetical protein